MVNELRERLRDMIITHIPFVTDIDIECQNTYVYIRLTINEIHHMTHAFSEQILSVPVATEDLFAALIDEAKHLMVEDLAQQWLTKRQEPQQWLARITHLGYTWEERILEKIPPHYWCIYNQPAYRALNPLYTTESNDFGPIESHIVDKVPLRNIHYASRIAYYGY